jgi:hypothetical protein
MQTFRSYQKFLSDRNISLSQAAIVLETTKSTLSRVISGKSCLSETNLTDLVERMHTHMDAQHDIEHALYITLYPICKTYDHHIIHTVLDQLRSDL